MDLSTHGRNNAAFELLRLLRQLLERLTDSELAGRRWQYCQVDELAEKMQPLWEEIGIPSPGIWIDRGTNYGVPTPCEFLHVRHPDLNETTTTALEYGDGEGHFRATVKDVAVIFREIQAWVSWLEAESRNREREIELVHEEELATIRSAKPTSNTVSLAQNGSQSTDHGSSTSRGRVDDALPKSKRAESPSRLKARSAYDYAMARIPDANLMTAAELFDAIREDREAAEMLPRTPETFTKYLNDCGIRLRKGCPKVAGESFVRRSDL